MSVAQLEAETNEQSLSDFDATSSAPSLTIVTSAYNEVGNVLSFLEETIDAVLAIGEPAELLYIDDGSTDGTADEVQRCCREMTIPDLLRVRLVRHNYCKGLSYAIEEAARLSQGDLVCLLPADMESSPAFDVPLLYETLTPDVDVVAGCRSGRGDGKRFTSFVGNTLIRWLFGVQVKDANWVKLIRREFLKGVQLRSDWHRYVLPILVHRGARVTEVTTPWNRRTYGRSKFGLRRIPVAVVDLIGLKFWLSFSGRPLLLFLPLATMSLLIGIGAAASAASVPDDSTRLWAGLMALSSTSIVIAVIWMVGGLLGDWGLSSRNSSREGGKLV